MYRFHATIHARSPDVVRGETTELDGRRFETLAVLPEHLATSMIVSFEQAGESLAALPRLFFEPDGSFVWVSAAGEPTWQIDGNLYDRAGRLLFVDAKGTCLRQQFDQLLAAFGWPQTSLMYQLVHEAVYLDEGEFRRFADV
jgi:hypothetical protein